MDRGTHRKGIICNYKNTAERNSEIAQIYLQGRKLSDRADADRKDRSLQILSRAESPGV